MREFYTPIECPCEREIFFTGDPFPPSGAPESYLAYCKCGRVWRLEEVQREDSYPEMDEEEELAYSLETKGSRDFRTWDPPLLAQATLFN